MTLEQAIQQIEPGVYEAHNWHTQVGDKFATLYHYDTMMLEWSVEHPSDSNYLWYDSGWGSKSDQDGMNRAFRVLGIPLHYTRNAKHQGYFIPANTQATA